MSVTPKQARAARNAWYLLSRTDSRSARRCRHWLREYGVDKIVSVQSHLQVPFELACVATGLNPGQWDDAAMKSS